MEIKFMELSKYSKPRKIALAVGVVVGLITLCLIYPLERSKFYLVEDMKGTFTGLVLTILLLLYGFAGPRFMKYLLLIVLSTVVSFACWYFCFAGEWGDQIVAVGGGVPSGIVAALLFFVLRYYLFFRNRVVPVEKKKKNILLLKQVVLYFLVLLIVSVVVHNGWDWIYYLTNL